MSIKILILTNNDVGLYRFRKELIERMLMEGYEVNVSLPNGSYINELQRMGCVFLDTPIDRRGTDPIKDLKLIIYYKSIIYRIKPDVVLTYTIKPNIYGGIVCKYSNTRYIVNVTGLGTIISNKGLLQKISLALYANSLRKAACVFFQNKANRRFFLDRHMVNGKFRLLPGSGVNLKDNNLEEYPDHNQEIRLLFIGRIMKDKGINELFQSAEKIKCIYPNVRFDLVGFCEENYTDRLCDFEKRGIVKCHGQQKDIHSFIKGAHAIILPSYHEGMANVLLEAASTGRPVLASNIPGCKETFEEGVSGFGFKPKSVESVVATVVKFINLPYSQKRDMGIAGRKKMERDFDRNIVVNAYMEEIERIVSQKKGNPS